jgi:cbb3-type cytochrome oxidase maturation protein
MPCASTGSNSHVHTLCPDSTRPAVAGWRRLGLFWAVGSGQFDDLDTPAMRIVMDDDTKPDKENKEEES